MATLFFALGGIFLVFSIMFFFMVLIQPESSGSIGALIFLVVLIAISFASCSYGSKLSNDKIRTEFEVNCIKHGGHVTQAKKQSGGTQNVCVDKNGKLITL